MGGWGVVGVRACSFLKEDLLIRVASTHPRSLLLRQICSVLWATSTTLALPLLTIDLWRHGIHNSLVLAGGDTFGRSGRTIT